MYRILIVEDEHIIRKGLIYGFNYEKAGCVIVGEANNGQQGIEKIKELNPDIVITDINMPVKDAFEMLEETMDYLYSTIIISGYDEFSNAQKAIKYGVSEFIVKPIDMEELAEAISRAKYQRKVNQSFIQEREKSADIKNIQLIEKEKQLVHDEVIREMIQFVNQNFNKRFVFQDVAKEIGYSSTLLHNRFKDYMNMTFNDYVNRYRIQKSIVYLKQNKLKLYEIAGECGFSDYKYFNKVFKKYINMSASEFMDLIKE
ncbi:response regulator transcription factor [Jeotgalibaca ciconiae]|uniref:Response regulator n=1 Tax=Jeotgalibaca ciconiae TaxID=2496265 RepID=A0A3S9HBQ1_9LACT|nr:response regulator [Jeotgalibaca ciconiae]AZP04799.1 response regulator [Jeotgalibaca ciconiae]